MKELKDIDTEITSQIESLSKIINHLQFNEKCQFNLNNQQEIIQNKILTELKYPGIYLIEIKNDNEFNSFESWIENFKIKWHDEKYLKKFVPNVKEKRIFAHKELNDWIPIYIGKSKNIGGRVFEHIYKELEKTTFALKLLARENLYNETFRLSTICINVKNYDVIVPEIEKEMRNRINPILGKQ